MIFAVYNRRAMNQDFPLSAADVSIRWEKIKIDLLINIVGIWFAVINQKFGLIHRIAIGKRTIAGNLEVFSNVIWS